MYTLTISLSTPIQEKLLSTVYDKTNSKSGEEEWKEHCKYEPYKDWKVRKWELKDRKMQLYILP